MEEETNNPLRDKYGRFPHYASSNPDVFSPLVSQFIHSRLGTISYPDDRKFAVCLSHDVDFLTFRKSAYLQSVLLSKSLLKGDLSTFKKQKQTPRAIHPDFSLENTLAIEKKFNARSSFYFLALDETEQDFNYKMEEALDQLKMVEQSGCEIGLHGGHGASEDISILKNHKKKLESACKREISGYRSHFLRLSVPKTWELLEAEGFLYDTTLGFSDCAGFRNGMCHPFYPWNPLKKKFGELVEVPLVIMDVTLFNHMQLDVAKAKQFCLGLLDKVEKVNGVLSFLWHNNNMKGAMGEFYSWFLSECKRRNAWLTDTRTIVEYALEEKIPARILNVMKEEKEHHK